MKELINHCHECGLDALVEVHNEKELDQALNENSNLIGINNRNLKDLSVNVNTTVQLVKKVPKNTCVVSESGIQTPDVIRNLKKAGIHAALIGESIIRSKNMSETLSEFVRAGQD